MGCRWRREEEVEVEKVDGKGGSEIGKGRSEAMDEQKKEWE